MLLGRKNAHLLRAAFAVAIAATELRRKLLIVFASAWIGLGAWTITTTPRVDASTVGATAGIALPF